VFHVLRVVLAIQAILFCQAPLRAHLESEGELLDFVRDAHRASREAIRTCSCRVEFKGDLVSSRAGSDSLQSCSGRYWVSPDAVRGIVLEFGQELDYLWTNSVRQSVSRAWSDGKHVVGAGRSAYASSHLGRCDPWNLGLLLLNQPSRGINTLPFEQLVAEASRVRKVHRKTKDGEEMIVVALSFEGTKELPLSWEVEIQFDPAVNYLVRRVSYTTSGEKGRMCRENEITEFKECTPGVFFPERARGSTVTEGGKPFFTYSVVLSDIQVNEPLPDEVFRFRYPEGIILTDGIRGTSYRVDAEGNPISPETPMGTVPPPAEGEPALHPPGHETREEPRPASRWILPVSLGMLALGGILFVVRRRRTAARG
jgi:hypothetical protein